MAILNFEPYRTNRQEPMKKQVRLYRAWVKYLSNSKLDDDEVHKRASIYASSNKEVPKD